MVAGLGRAGPAAPHFNAYNTVICESMPCNRQTFRLALQRLALLPLSSRIAPAFVPLQQWDNFRVTTGVRIAHGRNQVREALLQQFNYTNLNRTSIRLRDKIHGESASVIASFKFKFNLLCTCAEIVKFTALITVTVSYLARHLDVHH